MRKLGVALVDVNAQNASLALRTAATQRGLLDMIAGTAPLAAQFAACLQSLRSVQAQLHELQCAPTTLRRPLCKTDAFVTVCRLATPA